MRFILIVLFSTLSLLASVGKITTLSGDVVVVRSDNSINANVGMDLLQKDQIQTGKNAKAQIVFDDQTVITIGKSSVFDINEFLYDESSNSKFEVGFAVGAFKAITGKIGKVAKERFKIETKNATIGIRGTHIIADISEEVEHIACTQGEITVTVGEQILSIKQGSMTTIEKGLKPTAPQSINPDAFGEFSDYLNVDKELIKEISHVTLDTTLASYEQAKELKEKIAMIENESERVAALDLLDDELNDQLDSILEDEYYKISYPTTLQPSSYHNLGVYTEKNIIQNGENFLVGSESFSDIETAVAAAKPVEVFQDNLTDTTSIETMEDFMGAKVDDVYLGWDGGDDAHYVSILSGKNIGYYKDRESGLYATIAQQNNDSKILFDFGNQFFLGYTQMQILNTSKNFNKEYVLGFIGANKSVSINPSSFYTQMFYVQDDAKESFVSSQLFTGRYFGQNLSSVSAYLNILTDKGSKEDGSEAKNIVSTLVADQDFLIKLTQHPIDANEYLSWGYWADESFDLVMGGYVKPAQNSALTDSHYIESLIAKGASANYKGSVFGSVHQSINTQMIHQTMSNGKLDLNFDFQKQDIQGLISFDTPSDHWKIGITNGSIQPDQFTMTDIANVEESTQTIYNFHGSGKFYGDKAQAIGGGFQAVSTDAKTAIGVFEGVKQ